MCVGWLSGPNSDAERPINRATPVSRRSAPVLRPLPPFDRRRVLMDDWAAYIA